MLSQRTQESASSPDSPGCSHPRQAVSCSLAGFITSRRGTKIFQNRLPLLHVELGVAAGGAPLSGWQPVSRDGSLLVVLGERWCPPSTSQLRYSLRGAGCVQLSMLWDRGGGREGTGTPAAVPSLRKGHLRMGRSFWAPLFQARPFRPHFSSLRKETRVRDRDAWTFLWCFQQILHACKAAGRFVWHRT